MNQDKIEDIKKILREVYWEEFDYSQPDWKVKGNRWFDKKAKEIRRILEERLKEQDAKTASIKDKECQERVEGIFKEIEDNSAIDQMAYRDGGGLLRTIPEATWQVIKKQEEKKNGKTKVT